MIKYAVLLVTALSIAAPVYAGPNRQMVLKVERISKRYDIPVNFNTLTTAQAAALVMLVESGGRRRTSNSEIRQKGRAIMNNPDFAD
ncbi:hypothetical protein [Palleronia caenipelagi]|uniref:Uncharacterized protein n=1 Tax=Palleronia caenipelagi TaxID=2489174 RepID=A0A547Q5P0_9RHOB|nr:hypothetical protein [Palleronia caenipelagi]TRD21689.1 hypothetical protein FEV53_08080 [Palleronia caenipelagi]